MKTRIDYNKELNPAQALAVQSADGPHLVIAGAGSGKTRVLVYRVAYLVEHGVKPEEILLLTFTRKAAGEMLRRASLLLDERCQKVSGGTFHSFANMALRRYAGLLGLPNNFTILDESDAEDTVNLVRTQLGYNKSEKRFPRKKALLEVISKSVNKSAELATVVEDEYPQFLEWMEDIKKIRAGYHTYKKEKGLLDYDDLLVYLKNLLTNHEQVRSSFADKYRYIMVDEYQDTNKLQAHIAYLLASRHKNIMVVGDDAQSIYSFRGANFKNIIDFPKVFPGTKIITLEENYRSVQPILNLTNEVIRYAGEKFEKNLFTRKPGTERPVFVETEDEHAQSRFVAEKILELREEGVELGKIAVLFRSGWHSNDLEVELASRDIPFVKYGGQKFVEAGHIKDAIAFLRIAHNISDAVSWLRVLLLIPGIGPKTAERILDQVIGRKQGLKPQLSNKSAHLKGLFDLLRSIEPSAHSPAEILRACLRYYDPLLKEKYDDFHRRINDLDSLERIAGRYGSLEVFLTDMALEPPERNLVEPGFTDKDDSRLTLSTIHSAKGLEWHTVFILYVAEGHIPSYLSLEDAEAIDEERRLFYVAATRAKEKLYLLKPHIDRSPRSYFGESASIFAQTSRFLSEGAILDKFVEIQDFAGSKKWEEFLNGEGGRSGNGEDRDFLKFLDDYFSDEEGEP